MVNISFKLHIHIAEPYNEIIAEGDSGLHKPCYSLWLYTIQKLSIRLISTKSTFIVRVLHMLIMHAQIFTWSNVIYDPIQNSFV